MPYFILGRWEDLVDKKEEALDEGGTGQGEGTEGEKRGPVPPPGMPLDSNSNCKKMCFFHDSLHTPALPISLSQTRF